MARRELPVATRAFFLGIRLTSRRYLAPGKVWVRPALTPTACRDRAPGCRAGIRGPAHARAHAPEIRAETPPTKPTPVRTQKLQMRRQQLGEAGPDSVAAP